MSDSKKIYTLQQVLQLVSDYKPSGNGYMALCPAHDDSMPSLSINEGKDGRLLLHCFRGCSFEKILKSLHKKKEERKIIKKPRIKKISVRIKKKVSAEATSEPSPIHLPPPVLPYPAVTDQYHETALELINLYTQGGGFNGTPPGGRIRYSEGDFFRYRADETFKHLDGVYELIPKDMLDLQLRDAGRLWGAKRQRQVVVTETFLKHARLALQCELLARDGDPKPNSEPGSLNLRNCIFNLDTMRPSPHTDEFFSTIQLPVMYDPEAKCPLWLKTLDEIFAPDSEEERAQKVKTIQQFFGYCMTTDASLHKFLVLLGEGRNGKDTVVYQLQRLLGEKNYSALSMEQFAKDFTLHILQDKLVNITAEIGSKSKVSDDILKKITGQSPIYSDRKHREGIMFTAFTKLIFAMNTIPLITDHSHALLSRLIVVKFPRQFTDKEIIPALREKIFNAEASGLLNWSLQGYKDLRAQGRFILSKAMENDAKEFMRENNSVMKFGGDWLIKVSGGVCFKDRTYRLYVVWCDRNHCRPFTQSRFSRMLKQAYPNISEKRTTDGQWIWVGIEFNQQAPEAFRQIKAKPKAVIKKRRKAR